MKIFPNLSSVISSYFSIAKSDPFGNFPVGIVSGIIYILDEMHKNGSIYKTERVVYQHAVDITSATIYIGRPIIVKANKSL